MAVKRRMAPKNAATRTLVMDAVEFLMREQGYAAVSARAVAAQAGLKYPTVFYYFETMDHLLLATYRRHMQRVLERTEAALTSKLPMHALWAAAADPADAALSIEYLAMSNHNQLIRKETIGFGERTRRVVADRLGLHLRGAIKNVSAFTPLGISLSLSSLGGIQGFEAALGISGGHREVSMVVDWVLKRLEPQTRVKVRKTPRRPRGQHRRPDTQA